MKSKIVMVVEVNENEMDGEGTIEAYVKMTLENSAAEVQVLDIDARIIE